MPRKQSSMRLICSSQCEPGQGASRPRNPGCSSSSCRSGSTWLRHARRRLRHRHLVVEKRPAQSPATGAPFVRTWYPAVFQGEQGAVLQPCHPAFVAADRDAGLTTQGIGIDQAGFAAACEDQANRLHAGATGQQLANTAWRRLGRPVKRLCASSTPPDGC